MKLPRPLSTSAMRLAIRYALFYALLLILVGLAFLWSTQRSVDKDIEAELLKEYQSLAEEYKRGGQQRLIAAVSSQDSRVNGMLYLLTDNRRRKLAGDILHLPEDFESSEETDEIANQFFTQEDLPAERFDDDVYLPTLQHHFVDGSTLLIAHPSSQADLLLQISEYLLEFSGMAILLSLLIGFSLGYAVLRRIDTINRTADTIMQGDITKRIPLSGHNDEFDVLSTHLNTMMDRIQKLIESIREVSDNVAHDLRSPLNRLRNNLEVTLLEQRSSIEYREALEQGVEDIEALLQTFNALLSIAQAESGNHRTQWREVNLNELLANVVELYTPVAEEKSQSLDLIQHDQVVMKASRDLLAQAFSNLVENALKYTPEFGQVGIALERTGTAIEISFKDSGPGISASEREHVLERFVRLDNSRHTPGNGLGLSLVNAVCELHNGRLILDDAKPGLLVTLSFPLTKA